MEKRIKRLIKWLYFEYVYPDEVDAIYKILDTQPIVYLADGPMGRAIIEREWIPIDELH